MNNNEKHLVSVVQSAVKIASPSQRKEFLDKSCAGKPGLRTRLQAIVNALPEDNALPENVVQESRAVRGCEDSVLQSIAPERPPNVVLDDSLLQEAEPVIQPTSAEIPKTIDSSRYQLQGEVARGGMGVVLKGRDTDLGRNLAIKVLLDEHKENPQVIQRFVEEAQIGGQLQHPGIAPVYELGQFEDRRPFFTMKLVKGETLAYMLGGRRSVAQNRSKLLGIFEQVCQTMAYAHNRRVIHRDLKPANIMVGAFGEVQVMDWGLAKVLSDSPSNNPKPAVPSDGKSIIATFRSAGSDAPIPLVGSVGSNASDTQLGSAMGTPAYMPPEQALGDVDNMDRRSDVFGLGAILCEILTGQPPYVADDVHALMRLACRGNIDDCTKRLDSCGVDAELVELTKECLAFEQKDRPSDASDVASRLMSYLESVEFKIKQAEIERAQESARAVEEGKRRRVTLALAASVLLILALGGSGWMLHLNQVADRKATATRQFEDILNEAKLHRALAEDENLALRKQELELSLQSTESALKNPPADLPIELVDSARKLDDDVRQKLEATNLAINSQDRDRQLAEQLELIRVSHADSGKTTGDPMGATFDFASTSEQYAQAFAEAGFDFERVDEINLAAVIKQSAVREQLIGSLDHWIQTFPEVSGYEAYEALVSIADWKEAVAQARKNLEANPSNISRYMQLAVVLVLAGEREAYLKHARDMCDRFVTSKNPVHCGNTVKVCLLLPGAIDLDQIPTQPLERAVDEGLLPESETPVALGTRTMLAYRRGNLGRAKVFLRTALNAEVDWASPRGQYARQYLLAIRAMIEHDSGEVEKAKQTLDELRAALVEGKLTLYSAIILVHTLEAERHLGVAPSAEIARLARGNISYDDLPPTMQRKNERDGLISLVQQVDPNPYRQQVRSAILSGSTEKLLQLVEKEQANKQPPAISAWLGASLREAKQLEAAIEVLKQAQLRHPSDFWINYELALAYQNSARSDEALAFARTAFAIRPKSVAAQWALVENLANLKKMDDAEVPLRRMLANGSLSTDAKGRLAGKLMRYGRSSLARVVMEHVIEAEPDNRKALAVLGVLYALDREYDSASKAGTDLIELESDSPMGYVVLSTLHMRQGEFEQAAARLQQAVERKPDYAPFHVGIGQALTRAGRNDEAIAAFQRAIILDPKNQGAKKALVALLTMKENSSIAELVETLELSSLSYRSRLGKLQESLDDNPRDKASRFELATMYFKRAMYPEVLEQAEMILRAYPDEAVGYAMRGRVFRKQGKLDESIQEFRKAVELSKDAPNHGLILFRYGRALEDKAADLIGADPENQKALKFHDEAIATYREAYENDRKNAAIRRSLIHVLKIRGLMDAVDAIRDEFAKLPQKEAVSQLMVEAGFWIRNSELSWGREALDEVLEINPENRMAWLAKVDVLFMQRQFQKALEAAQQLAELTPVDQVQLTVAGLEIMTGRLEDSIQRISRILEDTPNCPGARAALAAALFEQGKSGEAISQCRQAIEEDPSDYQAHLTLATCLAEGRVDDRSEQLLSEALRHAEIGIRGADSINNTAKESAALATLGVVHYRQGEWQKTTDTLHLARDTAPDLLLYRPEFLAMAHWQLGEKSDARKWLDVANDHFEMHDVLLPSQQRAWNEAKELIQSQN